MDNNVELENKQSEPIIDRPKAVGEEPQGENIQNEGCDDGKNHRTLPNTSVTTRIFEERTQRQLTSRKPAFPRNVEVPSGLYIVKHQHDNNFAYFQPQNQCSSN